MLVMVGAVVSTRRALKLVSGLARTKAVELPAVTISVIVPATVFSLTSMPLASLSPA